MDQLPQFCQSRRCYFNAPFHQILHTKGLRPGANGITDLVFARREVIINPSGRRPPVDGGPGGGATLSARSARRSSETHPLAHLKVNCPEGAREGGLGHWLLSVRAESNTRTSPRRAEPSKHKNAPAGTILRGRFLLEKEFIPHSPRRQIGSHPGCAGRTGRGDSAP